MSIFAAETEETTTEAIKIGTAVNYLASNGDIKLAFVTVTPETFTAGSPIKAVKAGHVHLVVVSPTGSVTARYNVPSKKAAKAAGLNTKTNVFKRIK